MMYCFEMSLKHIGQVPYANKQLCVNVQRFCEYCTVIENYSVCVPFPLQKGK